MRKTVFSFGLIFLLGVGIIFLLQDIVMGVTALIFVPVQVLFLVLLFLVVWELYHS